MMEAEIVSISAVSMNGDHSYLWGTRHQSFDAPFELSFLSDFQSTHLISLHDHYSLFP